MVRVNANPDPACAPRRSVDRRGGFHLVVLATVLAATGLQACSGRVYDPARATRRYPTELDQERMLEIQVIRDGGELIVVNATPQSFADFDIWVNRRYMYRVDRLEAGETRRFWFGDFFDEWGESPVAGGFFRTERPTPAELVQFQIGETSPLLGVVAVPADSLD